MDLEIYTAFTRYASIKNPRGACQVWEDALVSYMMTNPVNGLKVMLHQIAVALPSKRDELRMKNVSSKLEIFMNLIDRMKQNGGDPSKLKEKILTWVMRGTEIKNTSEEFVELLERAQNYV